MATPPPVVIPPVPLSYASPHTGAGNGVFRMGEMLVADRTAMLPPRCVKCNAPIAPPYLRRTLSWHHPCIYLALLTGILLYLILALVLRKTATIQIGLCANHRKVRLYTGLACWALGLLLPALLFYLAVTQENGYLALAGLFCLLGSLFWAALCMQLVHIDHIDDRYIYLRKLPPGYLDDLPPLV